MTVTISNHPLFKEFSHDEIAEILDEFNHQKFTILRELDNEDENVSLDLRHTFHKSIGSLSYFLSADITSTHRKMLSAMDNHSFSKENRDALRRFYSEIEFSI